MRALPFASTSGRLGFAKVLKLFNLLLQHRASFLSHISTEAYHQRCARASLTQIQFIPQSAGPLALMQNFLPMVPDLGLFDGMDYGWEVEHQKEER
jgi:hypothetical protein